MSEYFLFCIFFIHTQSVIFKQNRPQHPDVYVHYLKSDLTAYWLNRALGLLHCRGKTHHEPHRSTPATQLPWRRLTLMDSEPGCGRTVPIYVQCVLPSIYLTWSSFPSPKLQNKNHDGQQALRHYWGPFFTYYKIMRAQSHAVLLNGLFFFSFFCTEHSRCSMRRDHSILTYYRTSSGVHVLSLSLQNAIRNPKLTFNIQFINSKRWANLIITIIIPTIPQEWKYNTSKNISSTRTARDIWLYWKLKKKKKTLKRTVNKNSKFNELLKKIDIPCPQPDFKNKTINTVNNGTWAHSGPNLLSFHGSTSPATGKGSVSKLSHVFIALKK